MAGRTCRMGASVELRKPELSVVVLSGLSGTGGTEGAPTSLWSPHPHPLALGNTSSDVTSVLCD